MVKMMLLLTSLILSPPIPQKDCMHADVARRVFAFGDGKGDGPILQQLIQGSGVGGSEDGNDDVNGQGEPNRIPFTVMIHMMSNGIRLPFFDSPCFFVVPCLTFAEVQDWNGGPYAAIVLTGSLF
jgi:hypothetical protein